MKYCSVTIQMETTADQYFPTDTVYCAVQGGTCNV